MSWVDSGSVVLNPWPEQSDVDQIGQEWPDEEAEELWNRRL